LVLLRFSLAACFFHLEDMLVVGVGSAFWRNSNVYKTYYLNFNAPDISPNAVILALFPRCLQTH
jgi:hypothetical protein